jgi:hypothetical protein
MLNRVGRVSRPAGLNQFGDVQTYVSGELFHLQEPKSSSGSAWSKMWRTQDNGVLDSIVLSFDKSRDAAQGKRSHPLVEESLYEET